jgi:hypothetical protein
MTKVKLRRSIVTESPHDAGSNVECCEKSAIL